MKKPPVGLDLHSISVSSYVIIFAMDPLISYKLDKDIFKNEKEYFFTFLSNRFDLINCHLAELLEKRFNKKFEPIFILSGEPNRFYKKKNYIILNEELRKYQKMLKTEKVIFNQEYEDLNKEFSKSKFIKRLIKNLAKKQDKIFITGFTTSFLNINYPKVVIIGPNPKIATKYDNKIEHIKLFRKLSLPRNKTHIFDNYHNLLKRTNSLLPFFVSAEFTSGGGESKLIHSTKELDNFFQELRPINKNGKFLVAELFQFELTPNVNAMVTGRNDTRIILITDQILHNNAYMGNIYPSKANRKNIRKIERITKKVGNFLSRQGYRGLFGLDFLVNKHGKLCVIDLNPRRQGGYLCNWLVSNKTDIIDCELKLALGEKIEHFDEKDFQVNYSWAHSKIKPHYNKYQTENFKTIRKEIKANSEDMPFEKTGKEFISAFFPKDHVFTGGVLGYYIASRKKRDELKQRVKKLPDRLIEKLLEEK